MRVRLAGRMSCGELGLEGLPLIGAETADPAPLGDGQPLHDLLRPDLPDTGHGLQQGHDLDLAGHVVVRAAGDDLGQGDGPGLEAGFQLGALGADLRGPRQVRGALLGGDGR